MAFFGFFLKKRDSYRRITTPGFRLFPFGFFAFLILFNAPRVVHAAELIMFEDPGCEWCQVWNEEVGSQYKDTKIGQSVPLRRIMLSAPRTGNLKSIKNIRYTPTFIVVHNGKEVGRITGYPGEAFFWGYLEEIVGNIDRHQGRSSSARRIKIN